ncbi:glycerol-3-phosphate acyltransferase, partial [Bacteroidota bacterium]
MNNVKKRLLDSAFDQNDIDGKIEDEILIDIINRYANEIAGRFKTSQYRLTRRIVLFGFRRLLNAARLKKFGALFHGNLTLHDKIEIVGEKEHLRKLAKIGTIVM